MQVLDFVEAIEADGVNLNNQLLALACLGRGLGDLYNSVLMFEMAIQEYEKENRSRVTFSVFGNLERFGIEPSVEYLLPCYFHWFANTICNYARLVGLFKGISHGKFGYADLVQNRGGPYAKMFCNDYVDSIFELIEIKQWRNKVSAHFAATDPFSTDSSALLQTAGMAPAIYSNSRFRVEEFKFASNSDERQLLPWSLTEKFELLAPRFWPEYVVK